MVLWKNAIKRSLGFIDFTEIPELKYSTYKPNAVDKVFFKISYFAYYAFWLFLLMRVLLGACYQPDFVYFDFFGYFDVDALSWSAYDSYFYFMLLFYIVFVTVPGLPLSVYLCKFTGYKTLKIDIGLRLIIIFVSLCYLMPTAIQCLIAYIKLF